MHFACRSFIGKHSDFNWSQYWENEPDDTVLVSQKGHLFGLVNFILDSGSSDISVIGKDLIFKINSFYFSQDGDILSSLKSTLNHFKNELSSQFIQNTLTLTVVHYKKVFFASYHTSHIIFQRQNKICQIISGQEYQFENSCGEVLDGDKILICTNDFFQNIGFPKLKTSLAEKNLQAIEEIFLSELYTLNNQPNLAGALIEIHFDDTENNPSSIDSSDTQEVIFPVNSTGLFNSTFKPSFVKKIFSRNSGYISHHDVSPIIKRKKINLFIGALLLIGLIVSFYFGYQKNQEKKIESEYQTFKLDLNKKISESIAIKNINLDSALNSAKDANIILEKIQILKVHISEVQALKKQVDELLTQTGQAPTASSHDIFLDLKSIFNDHQFSKFTYINNEIILIDSIAGSIDSVDVSTNKTKNILKSPQVKNITSFNQNNGSIYYVSGNMLYVVDQGAANLKIDFNKLGFTISDISFWNGVLYVLDSSKSKIYKFVPSGSNFDSGAAWLKEGSKIDSNTISLSINSSIWLLSESGNIRSFTRGIEDKINFSSSNISQSGKKIISSIDAGIIVTYDKQNFVYLYKNTGDLISKYNFSDKKIVDITVNEKDNYVYILVDDQKIYSIKL